MKKDIILVAVFLLIVSGIYLIGKINAKDTIINFKTSCNGFDGKRFKVTTKQCEDYNIALNKTKNSKEFVEKNWLTEENLPVIEKNKQYDFAIIGSSHARLFSRYSNHERVENILNKKFINLSRGSDRSGLLSLQTYIKYFYNRGNSVKTLVYFIEPYMFFYRWMDENPNLYDNEPFRLDFYRELLMNPPKNPETVESYFSKVTKEKPKTSYSQFQINSKDEKIASAPAFMIEERLKNLYFDGYDNAKFDQDIKILLDTINLAKQKNTRVVLIVPTTLLTKPPIANHFYEAIEQINNNKLFEFYNYSNVTSDLNLYYDIDHLNTTGIINFTENYLRPILEK